MPVALKIAYKNEKFKHGTQKNSFNLKLYIHKTDNCL